MASFRESQNLDLEAGLKQIKTEHILNEADALTDEGVKKEIAGILFNKQPNQIAYLENDPYFKYFNAIRKIQKINVRTENGQRRSFYLKNSWEGKYLEGCGMALHNIFFEDKFNFILSEKRNSGILAIEEVPGVTLWDAKEKIEDIEVIRSYGLALEFASMIGLADRESKDNFILTTNNNIINIDFGKIFQRTYANPIAASMSIPKRFKSQLEYGRTKGRRMLLEKLEDNKNTVESIIEEIIESNGFDNTKYASVINQKYINNTYNTFINNLTK